MFSQHHPGIHVSNSLKLASGRPQEAKSKRFLELKEMASTKSEYKQALSNIEPMNAGETNSLSFLEGHAWQSYMGFGRIAADVTRPLGKTRYDSSPILSRFEGSERQGNLNIQVTTLLFAQCPSTCTQLLCK